MFRLEQRKLGGRQQVIVVDSGEIKVSSEGPNSSETWTTPIVTLEPNPVRFRKRPIIPWVLAGGLALVALGFILVAVLSIQNSQPASTDLIYASVIIVIACRPLAKALSDSINATIFRGPRPLVLWFNNPDKQKFHQFVEGLSAAIIQEREKLREQTTPGDGSISGEIDRLKRLHEQGYLDEDQYRAAVNKIVGA